MLKLDYCDLWYQQLVIGGAKNVIRTFAISASNMNVLNVHSEEATRAKYQCLYIYFVFFRHFSIKYEQRLFHHH